VLVYHARNYTEIEGDPLYDPNRHTRLKRFAGTKTGCLILASRQQIRIKRNLPASGQVLKSAYRKSSAAP
jgi:hypothetical protein